MTEVIAMIGLVGVAVALGFAPGCPHDASDPKGAEAQTLRRAEVRGALALAVFGFATLTSLWALVEGRPVSALMVAGLGLLATPLLYPWPIARHLLIPLGAWRSAHVVARFGGRPWLRDPSGGSVLCGVLALMRCTRRNENGLCQLERLLGQAPLRGGGIVAAGLIAAERGDLERARVVLASIDELDPTICPPLARSIATDWIIADAAALGRWSAIVERCETSVVLSRAAQFFGLAARRMQGAPVSRVSLIRLWVNAPRRRHTLALLRIALAVQPPAFEVVDMCREALPANGGGLLASAAPGLHLETAQLALTHAVDEATLHRLADSWDRSLWDIERRRAIRERALKLDCSQTVESLMVDIRREVCRDLGGMLPTAPLCTPPSSRGTLGRAFEMLRRSKRHELAESLMALTTAQESKQSTPMSQLWTHWSLLREAYVCAARASDQGQARQTFSRVEPHLYGVVHWLWHDRGERGIANAISVWLVCEAERLRDAKSAAFHRPFAAAGP